MPQGLEALEKEANDVVEIDLSSPEEKEVQEVNEFEGEHFQNLSTELDQEALNLIALEVLNSTEEDNGDRAENLRLMKMGLDLMGIQVKEKNEPFQGACGAQHPLLMENAVKFQAKASAELLPADGPVQVKVIGDKDLEKEKQALRVQNHLNYQITEEMTEYYTDTERLLLYTAIMGSSFKKTFYDPYLERPVSEFIPADQFVVPNNTSDLERAERYTHIIFRSENQMNASFMSGMYAKPGKMDIQTTASFELNKVQEDASKLIGIDIGEQDDDSYTLYEQHVNVFIEDLEVRKEHKEFQVASPYIITVDAGSKQVLSIRRNWDEEDAKRKKLLPFTHWGFVPGFGFYNYGYLHLLGNLQLTLTAALRSLVDAGQFANLQGGFKLKGVRISDDGDPIHPGEFKDIEAGVMDINKAIMPLPFKGADQTLFQMLQFVDMKGQQFADSTEQTIADASNMGPVGTTLALLDASTKFFSGVHKRLHLAQKKELKIIAYLNSKTLEDNAAYNERNEQSKVTRQDYDKRVDIVPVSDPNISSNAHRMAKAQTLLDIALKVPDQHDMKEVLKHVYINMDYPNIEKILPEPQQAKPEDPLTDINNAVQGKPIQAFSEQDHKSHIAIKSALVQDPSSALNPLMAKAKILVESNIQEHMVMQFVQSSQAEQQSSGTPLEQATQAIAVQNQEKQKLELEAQKEEKDEVASILAKAEMLQEITQADKLEFEKKLKTAELELDRERLDLDREKEYNKLIQVDAKAAAEMKKLITTQGLDAMGEALRADVFDDESEKEEKVDAKE